MLKRYLWIVALLALAPRGPVTLSQPTPSDHLADWTIRQHREAQTQTMHDCRIIGNAWMAWVTDELSAPPAGADVFRTEDYPPSSYEEMKEKLVPDYIEEVPRTDGWGHPYEFRVAWDDPMATHVYLIRSPGRDGKFADAKYEGGSFEPDDFDQDIVWADGFFIRWPRPRGGEQ